jgi:phosphoribosylanthranilate isomerase
MDRSVPARTRVKICGITNRQDAEAAIALGADALGFNTWRGTRRFIDLEQEGEWLRELPPFVAKVALLVNAPLADAERVARLPFIDALQLHGDEDAGYCRAIAQFGKPWVKALRVRDAADLAAGMQLGTRFILIDAHVAGAYGGTGVRVDLSIAAEFRQQHPEIGVILAGGLRPENVAAAVRAVRPYAVDVSSGVEREPGRKNPALMKAFIEAATAAGE